MSWNGLTLVIMIEGGARVKPKDCIIKKVVFWKVSSYVCKAVHSVCLGYTFYIPVK